MVLVGSQQNLQKIFFELLLLSINLSSASWLPTGVNSFKIWTEWPDGFTFAATFSYPLLIGADNKFLYYLCIFLSSLTVLLSLKFGSFELSPLELRSLLASKVKQSGYWKDSYFFSLKLLWLLTLHSLLSSSFSQWIPMIVLRISSPLTVLLWSNKIGFLDTLDWEKLRFLFILSRILKVSRSLSNLLFFFWIFWTFDTTLMSLTIIFVRPNFKISPFLS